MPVEDRFHYAVPEGAAAEIGVRVLVPYGGRRLVGVVIGVSDLVPKLILEKPLVQDEFEPLMKIDSGKEAPKDAYAAIQYRGNWFWIADTESRSKNTFQFLSLLLTITESGESGGGQVVIPAG